MESLRVRSREHEVAVLDLACDQAALADAAKPVRTLHVNGNAVFGQDSRSRSCLQALQA